MKENEHEIKGAKGSTIASIWWDGKKVQCSSPTTLAVFKSHYALDDTAGPEEIDTLASKFKSGYYSFFKV